MFDKTKPLYVVGGLNSNFPPVFEITDWEITNNKYLLPIGTMKDVDNSEILIDCQYFKFTYAIDGNVIFETIKEAKIAATNETLKRIQDKKRSLNEIEEKYYSFLEENSNNKMSDYLENLCDELDASVFSSDDLYSIEAISRFKQLLRRWNREADSIESFVKEQGETNV